MNDALLFVKGGLRGIGIAIGVTVVIVVGAAAMIAGAAALNWLSDRCGFAQVAVMIAVGFFFVCGGLYALDKRDREARGASIAESLSKLNEENLNE
jgi:hypothetical protein